MNRKRGTLILVVTMLLVAVLIGLPSMKFVQKLSAGCPLNQGKSIPKCGPCIYHTVVSLTETGDHAVAVSMSTVGDVQVSAAILRHSADQEAVAVSTSVLRSPVLRC
ncbi:MAG: hypothetical protein A4E57_03938 [Syntrophorhabdaceae bacterium PtaU1.Bin034]|jgi:hypothetical protein|nr:MAG: hypothetical protein A4E57_03938 [Syntrophorhabdaceae bacterium PtaU1.Bin034]